MKDASCNNLSYYQVVKPTKFTHMTLTKLQLYNGVHPATKGSAKHGCRDKYTTMYINSLTLSVN